MPMAKQKNSVPSKMRRSIRLIPPANEGRRRHRPGGRQSPIVLPMGPARHLLLPLGSTKYAFRLLVSRPGHGRPHPCTPCAQPCGQHGLDRGQDGPNNNAPHNAAMVPTAHHQVSTSAPRSVACDNGGRSTPSTPLTTATAVISSRALLLSNVGDEREPGRQDRRRQADRPGFPAPPPRTTPGRRRGPRCDLLAGWVVRWDAPWPCPGGHGRRRDDHRHTVPA
jgi:hypothetical protein